MPLQTENQRRNYTLQLDEEFLLGGVLLSEWTTLLVREADRSFWAGSPLASILAAQAAIECHLRFEYFEGTKKKLSFYELIEESPLDQGLRTELHELRKFRNRWVHVNDPSDDEDLLARPEYHQGRLLTAAEMAVRTLRQVLYLEQCV